MPFVRRSLQLLLLLLSLVAADWWSSTGPTAHPPLCRGSERRRSESVLQWRRTGIGIRAIEPFPASHALHIVDTFAGLTWPGLSLAHRQDGD